MGGLFDISKLINEKEELTHKTNDPNFWSNIEEANTTNQKLSNINKIIQKYNSLLDSLNLSLELSELEDINETEINNLTKEIEELEINTLLNGKYDNSACYLEIHPGAGGTESCDWASMLLRMYKHFLEQNNYKYKVIDYQAGDEAGLKSVTLFIEGEYAYGYLKCEQGTHRLVRISPFDANKRRHTSFASVSVTPYFSKLDEVHINEEDLKIDVYHSSGAGGQSVNTSNSAVRITHLPTKTVVTCQIERSQLRNKEVAMQMLQNKLYQQELAKREEEIKAISGPASAIDFGSQIRSYILEPYKLVKDHRSKLEISDPQKVLDGDIMPLIESVLKIK